MTSLPSPTRLPRWFVPGALVVLSLIPVLAGTARLMSLALGAEVTPGNARFHEMPIPVVLHILGATAFCLLGAFQFSPSLRSKHPGWHRVAGRVAWSGGLLAAFSGLWMTLYYPLHEHQLQGGLLFVVRLIVGVTMAVALVLAYGAIRRRNLSQHRAWMLRAYALGQGAGTQALVMLPWMLVMGSLNEATYDGLMTVAWLINVAVAEVLIRRSQASSAGHRVRPSSPLAPKASTAESAPPGP